MMRYTLLLLLFCCSVAVQCQTSSIQKTYAFTREELPGTIMVDEKGEPVKHKGDTTNIIYLETKGTVLDYQIAWIKGIPYKINLLPVNESRVRVGQLMNADKDVVITPKTGNKLWQVVLEPVVLNAKQPVIKGVQPTDIILQGDYKRRKFFYTIKNRVMLRPLLAM